MAKITYEKLLEFQKMRIEIEKIENNIFEEFFEGKLTEEKLNVFLEKSEQIFFSSFRWNGWEHQNKDIKIRSLEKKLERVKARMLKFATLDFEKSKVKILTIVSGKALLYIEEQCPGTISISTDMFTERIEKYDCAFNEGFINSVSHIFKFSEERKRKYSNGEGIT